MTGDQRSDGTGVFEHRWPCVDIYLPDVVDHDFTEFLATRLETILLRGERICLFVDGSTTRQFRLPEVKRIGAFATTNGERLDAQVAAMALAIPSAFVRGALKVLFTLKVPGHPYRIVRQAAEADAYLRPYLIGLGVRHVAAG